jgi:hypothetical protein
VHGNEQADASRQAQRQAVQQTGTRKKTIVG